MMIRIIILFAASVISGLLWDCGSDLGLAFNVAVRPIGLAGIVAILWRQTQLKWRIVLLVAAVIVSNVIANLTYALQTEAWYVTSDSETQLWIVVSFTVQTVVSLAVLFVVNKIVKKRMLNKMPDDTARKRADHQH